MTNQRSAVLHIHSRRQYTWLRKKWQWHQLPTWCPSSFRFFHSKTHNVSTPCYGDLWCRSAAIFFMQITPVQGSSLLALRKQIPRFWQEMWVTAQSISMSKLRHVNLNPMHTWCLEKMILTGNTHDLQISVLHRHAEWDISYFRKPSSEMFCMWCSHIALLNVIFQSL